MIHSAATFAALRAIAFSVCLLAGSHLLSTVAFAEANVVRVNASTHFRTEQSVATPATADRVVVELSSDLASWTPYPLAFDVDTETWSSTAPDTFTVAEQSDNGDGTWSITFDFVIDSDLFTRIETRSGPFPVDPTLTTEARNLLKNLHRIGWDPDVFAFGQEFPLSYRAGENTGNGDHDQSDVDDVVGDHPGVHGSDFVYMIDRPWEEEFHKAAARRAYEAGAIVTFDYHWNGKYGGAYQDHPEDDQILDHVVRNDDSRGDVTWFYDSLDRILAIINEDLQFPIVFRPFHEMDGDWFWWGRQIDGGAQTYREAYRLLVEYMSKRTEYVLYCWSPDVALVDFEQFYPGDEYVDVVGRDIYSIGNTGRPLSKLTEMIAFAEEHGKVGVFSETGYTAGGTSFETGDPDWWTTRILEPLKSDPEAGKIAWALTWINASWSGPYVPHAASPQAAKDDFIKFYDDPATLFQEEVDALDVYSPPPSD